MKLLIGVIIMSFACGAFAANSADLFVKGKITPRACTAFFPSGGTIDLGEIDKDLLKDKMNKVLGDHPFAFTVSCDSAAAISVSIKDQKSGTAHPDVPQQAGEVFGLGAAKEKNIGGFKLYAFAGHPKYPVLASPNKKEWSVLPATATTYINQQTFYALSGEGKTTPVRYTAHEYQFSIVVFVAGDLDLSEQIDLDGQATFEIHYI